MGYVLVQEALISHNKKQAESKKPPVVNFSADAVDQTHFPLKIWRRIANQLLTLQDSFRYGDPFGEIALREQISSYLFQSRGVKTDANAYSLG